MLPNNGMLEEHPHLTRNHTSPTHHPHCQQTEWFKRYVQHDDHQMTSQLSKHALMVQGH